MTKLTYSEQLQADYTRIRTATRAGTITQEERFTQIDETVGNYSVAHAEAYDKARETKAVLPINYKNDRLLDAFADLALYDDLTWDHADKMSIIEYPLLSASQAKLRRKREGSVSDVVTGKDDATIGRTPDKITGRKNRIYDYMTPERDVALIPAKYLDLYTAIDGAGLTDRQRQAIDLVYFDGLTQEGAAEEMGVSKPAVNQFITAAMTNIRRYMNVGT